jgi:uncharacterized membrane protein
MGAGLHGLNGRAWLLCMSNMDCSSYGSFDIKVTSSATVGVPQ